jgi:uncharacterized protein YegJ (DUF2314 family)
MRAVLLMVLVVACKKDAAPPPSAPPAPAKPVEKPIRATTVDERYIVVVPKGGEVDAVVKLARERLAAAHLGGEAKTLPGPVWSDREREVDEMIAKDLQPADFDGIASGTGVAVDATGDPISTLRALAPIAHDAAVAAHGWVLDPGSGGVFTAAGFEKHIPGDIIDVREQIFVHEITGGGEDPWLDTEGMRKLGLPELTIQTVAKGHVNQAVKLVNAVAQTMLARPDIKVPGTIDIDLSTLPGDWYKSEFAQGATGRARFRTAWHKDEEGEDEIELAPATGSSTEALEALVAECFGAEPDIPTPVKAHDPELEAAAARARSELSAMRSHFAKGVPFKERLSIKAPFTSEDGEVEWMWADVVRWTGDTLEGTLANDPDVVKTLKAGSHVKVPFAKVADFIHMTPDGKQTGGYSIEVFKKRGLMQ